MGQQPARPVGASDTTGSGLRKEYIVRSARHLYIAIMGAWMGAAGIEHGVGEFLVPQKQNWEANTRSSQIKSTHLK